MRITQLLSTLALTLIAFAPAANAAPAQVNSACSYYSCFSAPNFYACLQALPTCFDTFQGTPSDALTGLSSPADLAVDSNQDVITAEGSDLVINGSSTLAALPGTVGPIAIDSSDNVFASVHASGSDRGIYKVDTSGTATKIISLASGDTVEGMTLLNSKIYVTVNGEVLSAAQSGGSLSVDAAISGAGALQAYDDDMLYVMAGSDIKKLDPSTGTVTTYLSGLGAVCADFAFDVQKDIYCADTGADEVVKIKPSGAETTILDSSDGLDTPVSVVFGRGTGNDGERYTIYTADDDSVVKVELGKVGLDPTSL